jgi:hypothetical protein
MWMRSTSMNSTSASLASTPWPPGRGDRASASRFRPRRRGRASSALLPRRTHPRRHALLRHTALRRIFGEAGTEHDEQRDALGDAGLDGRLHMFGGQHNQCAIDPFGQIIDGGHGLAPLNEAPARIHKIEFARISKVDVLGDGATAKLARVRRGANDRQ